MTDQLHLTGIFGDVEDAIIKPGLIFRLDHYFIDHWLPILGPSRAWLVVALQQACWLGNTPGRSAEISQADLGEQCGLGRQRVNELLNHDPLLRWFVPAVQTQIKSGQQQNNRYQVWLTSPPTPALVAGLHKEIAERLGGGETLPDIVQSLTREATTARTALLERLLCGNTRETPQTIADVVATFAGDAMDDTLRQKIKQLGRALLQPFRARIETQYFRHHWLPILGPTAAWLVIVLRRGCYVDENEVRNDFSICKVDLAATLGVSGETLRRLLKNKHLPGFFADPDWQPGRFELTGHIKMVDPLTPDDVVKSVEIQQHQQTGNGQKKAQQKDTEPTKDDTVNGAEPTKYDTVSGAEPTKYDTVSGAEPTKGDTVNGAEPTKGDTVNNGNGQNTTPCQHFKDSAPLNTEPLKAVAALNTHAAAAAPLQKPEQPVDLVQHLLSLYREEIGQPTHLVKRQVKIAAIEIPSRALWDDAFEEMVVANTPAWRYVLAIARRMHRDALSTATPQAQIPQMDPAPAAPPSPTGQMWQETLDRLQLQMTRATFGWFENSEITSVENCVWCVTVPNDAAKEWLENRLYTTITRTAEDIAGQPVEIKFAVCQSPVPVQDTNI